MNKQKNPLVQHAKTKLSSDGPFNFQNLISILWVVWFGVGFFVLFQNVFILLPT